MPAIGDEARHRPGPNEALSRNRRSVHPRHVDAVLPVDVWIPGCPLSPLALLHGLGVAVGRLAEKVRDRSFTAPIIPNGPLVTHAPPTWYDPCYRLGGWLEDQTSETRLPIGDVG